MIMIIIMIILCEYAACSRARYALGACLSSSSMTSSVAESGLGS